MSLHHKECSKLKIKQNWNSRRYTFGIFKDPPGQVWADFVHKTDELVVLAEGEIEIDTDNSNKMVLTECWDSKEKHQTYFQWRQEGDPSGLLGELGPHMAGDPKFTWAEIKKTY